MIQNVATCDEGSSLGRGAKVALTQVALYLRTLGIRGNSVIEGALMSGSGRLLRGVSGLSPLSDVAVGRHLARSEATRLASFISTYSCCSSQASGVLRRSI